ncbi:MAG: glycoside hydrolase family 125 protein, partial [Calditrichaeota bacterium]|nr:glycoside hydrolase family 125 protein [Calditrichota bacterium]
IVKTFKTEQRKDGTSPYYFIRPNSSSNMIDAPSFSGKGRPVKPVGLICSMFRPSDDATLFPYLVPSNLFAIQSLRQLANIYKNELNNTGFAAECSALADEVEAAIKEYAIVDHPKYGKVYAYEVDGYGARVFMDDANVPSLISQSYIGYHKPDDEIYMNTRHLVLSTDNPYYLVGKAAEGQSSPHTGKENIWPMGIILRALTSNDQDEIKKCISMLKATHAGTGFMHESFHKDNPEDFSRKWFAWANTLFGEMILKTYHEHPDLLKNTIF